MCSVPVSITEEVLYRNVLSLALSTNKAFYGAYHHRLQGKHHPYCHSK